MQLTFNAKAQSRDGAKEEAENGSRRWFTVWLMGCQESISSLRLGVFAPLR
jgi:hypothetical protein